MASHSEFQQHYQQLKTTLLDIGYIHRGTLIKRFMVCGKPTCACHGTPPRLHGPYYHWTRKIRGKTQSRFFNPKQAQLVSAWIDQGRKLDRIIRQMERLSLRAIERLLKEAAEGEEPHSKHVSRRSATKS
jgi:hypothetical protein